MQDRAWMHRNNGKMQFSVRQASFDRCWTGFAAALIDTSGGVSQARYTKDHGISVQVGSPILTTSRVDGSVSRRLQTPGSVDLMPLGFSGEWQDEGPSAFLCIHLSPALVQTTAEDMDVNPDRVSLLPMLQFRDPQIEHLGWALKAELESSEPSGRLYADGLGQALAAHLLRQHAPLVPRVTKGLPKRRLQRVTDFIHDHLAQDLTLVQLAEVACVSPSHFKFLFKQSVGVPVHQYVIRSRVDFAIDMLVKSKLPLSDVALQAGFANQSHMARCVRRVTGLTPSYLRNLT
ncbi:MAG: helix-turn-helix transcriptional regulator [Candidatus Eremiobacteraeota bacterium]|nr:helix-turn-helix transcriptional regulator [Candidatus Eremiobacteraeota bacterium]MBV8366510.1 helix-turn-helix transcriptional regulator [Candidatus Eremiobacteraeota bacterium]